MSNNWNTGSRNTGDCNAGSRNTGDCNTGDCNTGNRNTGSRNTGDWNTGDCNTGSRNTGDCNTGSRNTGDCNTGDCNTGDWNTGNWNTGYCNTVTPDDCLIFNKPAKRGDWKSAYKPQWMYAALTVWVEECDMTEKEKDAFPSYITTGGYLKAYATLQDAWKDAWEKAPDEDKALTTKLPNYDREVFIEIFGFDPEAANKRTITINGKDITISEESFNELKKQLTEK